ncbi:MAG: kelch repeat-containing protein [Pirellulaceae bacterium]
MSYRTVTSLRYMFPAMLACWTQALAFAESPSETSKVSVVSDQYPAIPQMVTSFGAAVTEDAIYMYGGHTGGAHAYDAQSQAKTLWRLDRKKPVKWEALNEGPGLQGLSLVTHGGKLYRIGGFMAKNAKGEEGDLWSQASVSVYDPSTNAWTDLNPLPEPRSSFDAAVLNGKIYVVGGWNMQGDDDAAWATKAYSLDLNDRAGGWKALPDPPFQRRALSVAAYDGKIFAIGGMQEEGGPTTRVDIFDPQSQQWTQGPSLEGETMDGFGSSSFATGGELFAATYSGKLQKLSSDGKAWETVADLDRARFFHRLLPLSDNELVVLGGASMTSGKFDEVDVIRVR